jgi:hypothetical protein
MVSLLNPGIGVDHCRRRDDQLSPITVGRRLLSERGLQPTGPPVGMHAPFPQDGLLTAARYPVLAAPGERDVWLANRFILNHWDGRRGALVRSPLFPLSMYRQGDQKDVDAFATVSAHDIWALGRHILPGALPNSGEVPPGYHYGPLLAHLEREALSPRRCPRCRWTSLS